jgi:hypothetical protein
MSQARIASDSPAMTAVAVMNEAVNVGFTLIAAGVAVLLGLSVGAVLVVAGVALTAGSVFDIFAATR